MISLTNSNKGFFFLLDGVFAIVILVIGFLILSSHTSVETTEIPLSMISENAVNLLSSVKINELCDETYACSNQKLSEMCPSNIRNMDQTVLDYLGELYVVNKKQDAAQVFRNITLENDLFRQDIFGVELRINDEVIYFQGGKKQQAKDLISVKKVIFGFYEVPPTGEVVFWGPYLAEVDIWQK
ncbi:hypothetical protein JXC34_06330 [Candidatus Woesearchaeota archaeon]|nr:hypothetical protein [Candidatus Woesearchaeota archaeon]